MKSDERLFFEARAELMRLISKAINCRDNLIRAEARLLTGHPDSLEALSDAMNLLDDVDKSHLEVAQAIYELKDRHGSPPS